MDFATHPALLGRFGAYAPQGNPARPRKPEAPSILELLDDAECEILEIQSDDCVSKSYPLDIDRTDVFPIHSRSVS